jgi:hypothetical protein
MLAHLSNQSTQRAAAVLYIAKPTDAREVYVGLTRHKTDAYVVVERDRLAAAAQRRLSDVRATPSDAAVRERLLAESRSYAEKANVADDSEDRIDFMRTGQIITARNVSTLNLASIARAAQRIIEALKK